MARLNISNLNKCRSALLLILSLLFCYGVEWSASAFTRGSVGSWYMDLEKPFWNPPNLAFPIVWTILYTMIGISFWLILCNPKAYTPKVFLAFLGQMLLNFTWSVSFFYLQSPFLGLINILLLMGAISWNIYIFLPYSKLAARFLLPYLLWVMYATTLNVSIWLMN